MRFMTKVSASVLSFMIFQIGDCMNANFARAFYAAGQSAKAGETKEIVYQRVLAAYKGSADRQTLPAEAPHVANRNPNGNNRQKPPKNSNGNGQGGLNNAEKENSNGNNQQNPLINPNGNDQLGSNNAGGENQRDNNRHNPPKNSNGSEQSKRERKRKRQSSVLRIEAIGTEEKEGTLLHFIQNFGEYDNVTGQEALRSLVSSHKCFELLKDADWDEYGLSWESIKNFLNEKRSKKKNNKSIADSLYDKLLSASNFAKLMGTNDENTNEGSIWYFIRNLGTYNDKTGQEALKKLISSHKCFELLKNVDLSWQSLKELVDKSPEDKKAKAVYDRLMEAKKAKELKNKGSNEDDDQSSESNGESSGPELKLSINDKIFVYGKSELFSTNGVSEDSFNADILNSFKVEEKGSEYTNENETKYEKQCGICALDLDSEEEKSIPDNIRQELNDKGGISADSKLWKEIADIVKKRIFVYEIRDNALFGFFEYGKENDEENDEKGKYIRRVCLQNGHYQQLIVADQSQSKK